MKKQAIALAVALTLSVSMFASSSSAEGIYSVKTGDTLWEISREYNLSIAELQQLDEMDSIWINPDQDLNVQKEESTKDNHLIKYGDTLFSLALTYDVTVAELKEWNNLSSDWIYTGELLAVKASAAKPKTAVSTYKKPAATAAATSATKPTSAPANASGQTYTMRATAYTAYCEGCSGITANGTDIRSNPGLKVIAVDPRVIPLGTKVWVEGYGEAIAADTGGAIKGNKIDVFIPSDGQARNWGVRTVTVKILD
ncbi:LysM peptidoglycan-binding domain-containing protein [Lysinibacillus fusiformis]|nr:LysM peptidoglycan-binding domain-containing protein [Lysinibacillus fusiformis]